ncbi:MAG: glutamate mutase L [Candidatus Bathyarchaeota archaeon]|nr:MAG: glutamate mutase L [Candidatus Bathyarchaeota archaeon]
MTTEKFDPLKIKIILATDVGSTTTKAVLFKKIGHEWRYLLRGEVPTTVEAPFEDVRVGVRNAVREVEELSGLAIQDKNGIRIRQNESDIGVDLYVSTSSAGGGLQMTVAGLMKELTAESAERAALGAGAIVMDTLSIDDGRRDYIKVKRLRELRPDMILLAGGTDGGEVRRVLRMAELLSTAEPKPRLGVGFKLPVVYAGNKNARKEILNLLDEKFEVKMVSNLRPILEVEDSQPSREAIHELFLEHVMSHAPGYPDLMKWTSTPIIPTPAGEGAMFRTLAELRQANVIGVGLGGATTNIYSIFEYRFVRTVSANLGMSYSVCNVLKETGIDNIMRWIPLNLDPKDVKNRLRNKMIRPTTIPQIMEELIIEHAVAREALRLGFQHHKMLARGLKGVAAAEEDRIPLLAHDRIRSFDEEETYLDMTKIDYVAGTGGLLSHAPIRAQAAIILIDGFQVEGVVKLVQDSVFMIPNLGVLSTLLPSVALEIFEKDCLVKLGTCIAPRGQLDKTNSKEVITVEATMPDGTKITEKVKNGSMKVIPLGIGETAQVKIELDRAFNFGTVHSWEGLIEGGVVGIIIDARGRPLDLPNDKQERDNKLIEWYSTVGAYPKESFN